MDQTVSIGGRLREERTRLDMSQPAFGEIGGVTKKTQMLYEGGERFPDAQYLAAIAAAGADVLYILTGQRQGGEAAPSAPALSPRQAALLDNYDHADEAGKRYIERAADHEAQSVGKKAAQGGKR